MTQKEAINYLRQIYPNGGHCWLDEQRIEAIGMAVKALQEEPVSDDFEKALAKEWQEYNDRGAATVDALEDNTQELAFAKGFYRAWHYRKEEPISEKSENGDFTKELAECIHQAQCSVIDPLAHAEVWKEELVKLAKCEEPVSEDLEEASKEWLRPQLDKSYVNYGEAKMMELTHFDGYAMLDAIEFGAKWQKAKDESTTEDLGDYINELSEQFPEVSFAKLSRIAVRVAKWQKQKDSIVSDDLEKEIDNYVKRNGYDGLDSIEEVKYIANHFAEWQKEQMMAKSTETTFNVSLPSGLYDKLWVKGCKEGNKLLIIKKDEL